MGRKILAIDIGGSKMIAAVAELQETADGLNYQLGEPIRIPLVNITSEQQIFDKVDELASRLFQTTPLEEIDRIGVAIPGLTDERTWIFSSFSGIQNVPIADMLEKRYGRPVFIENDVNGCALAEGMFGNGRGVQDYAWITVSNGIGGGFCMDGKLYHGSLGFAAEFGHMVIEEESDFLCGCGNYGCFEALCAGPGIARYYTSVSPTGETLTAHEIAQRAFAGDPLAIQVFRREGELLGKTFAWIANILNPARIFLGGGVSQSWELFAPTMHEAFRSRIFQRANSHVRIEQTGLGYYAALIGAVAITLK